VVAVNEGKHRSNRKLVNKLHDKMRNYVEGRKTQSNMSENSKMHDKRNGKKQTSVFVKEIVSKKAKRKPSLTLRGKLGYSGVKRSSHGAWRIG